MKKVYYLEVFDTTTDQWFVQEKDENLNSLYETMYNWVNEGYRKIPQYFIRITEGWELV